MFVIIFFFVICQVAFVLTVTLAMMGVREQCKIILKNWPHHFVHSHKINLELQDCFECIISSSHQFCYSTARNSPKE